MSIIKHAWLTLNRQCNLRCRWCYAYSTKYNETDDMPIELADKIIDFLSEFQLDYVALIGGEPTCYPFLEEVIEKIYSNGMKPTLITNGLTLSDKEYLDALISAGLHGINLSIKGWSPESYFQNTGIDAYEKTLTAIKNIVKSPLEYVISFVISPDNVNFYLDAIDEAYKQGARNFYLSFEHDFSILDGNSTPLDLDNIFYMIDHFMESYDRLCSITNGNFLLHQSYPLCIWDKAFINTMAKNKQITTYCQLLERSGLVFDTNGSLIPCNSMYQLPIGKLGKDFNSKNDFELFWNNDRISEIYEQLLRLPSITCDTCTSQSHCGGGCIAIWLHNNHNQIMDAYQKWRKINKS